MRIIALGTGMPNQSPSNVAAAFLVELGAGKWDKFLFDLGTGSTDRLAGLAADYSKLEKVFISHLHIDHAGNIAALWVGGCACCLEPRNGLTNRSFHNPAGMTRIKGKEVMGTAGLLNAIFKFDPDADDLAPILGGFYFTACRTNGATGCRPVHSLYMLTTVRPK